MIHSFFAMLLLLPIGYGAEQTAAPGRTSDVLFASENGKYHLSCEFHGEKLELSGGGVMDDVQYVTVRDTRSGATARYKPIAPGTMIGESSYYSDVWSPDMEWMVLPLGQMEGFQLVRARDALRELRAAKPVDFVRIETWNGLYLAHGFVMWLSSAPSTFTFTVGLDGDVWGLEFNLADHSIRSPDGVGGVMVTPKGKTEIPRRPGSMPHHRPPPPVR